MLGVGTDILKISNLSYAAMQPEDSFIKKTFTCAEAAQAAGRELPLYYYATHFAGKEAVFKSLGLDASCFRPHEIEILNDESGRPHASLSGETARRAGANGVARVLVSLSYDTDYAVAYAAALGE